MYRFAIFAQFSLCNLDKRGRLSYDFFSTLLRVGGEADIVRTPVVLNPGLLGNQKQQSLPRRGLRSSRLVYNDKGVAQATVNNGVRPNGDS